MANARFSKINVGKINKRGKFDLSHSVATTADFGMTQPLLCKLMIPNSTLSGSIDGAIRCMPMPLPVFGKCGFHFYGQFIKMSSLLKNFGSFATQTMFNTSTDSYIPKKLPNVPVYGPVSLFTALLSPKFSSWVPIKMDSYVGLAGTGDVVTSPSGRASAASIAAQFSNDVTVWDNILTHVIPATTLSATAFNNELGYSYGNNSLEAYHNGFVETNRIISGSTSSAANKANWKEFGDAGFSVTNADFYLFLLDGISVSNNPSGTAYNNPIMIPVWLTAEGRNLLKIIQGLGIQINTTDTSRVNVMPLFAYYKAWFDIFAPQRSINWEGTSTYKFLDYLSEHAIWDLDELINKVNTDLPVSWKTFVQFLYDLSQTYTTCDPNYFTSSVNNYYDYRNDGYTIEDDLNGKSVTNVSLESATTGAPIVPTTQGGVTAFALAAVNKLSRYINTNTVIGHNIDAFFKAHFDGYAGTTTHSDFAGSSVLDIELGDVIVTSDTDQADAGEFAGVGFGRGDYKIKVSSKGEFGYFIVIGAIVPKSDYVQGSDYDCYITKPLELPQAEFDALGYDKLRIGEIFGSKTKIVGDGFDQVFGNNPYGYQPRYTGHKVANSRFNGDFALRGTRDNYLAMTLNNYISQDVTSAKKLRTPSSGLEDVSYINSVAIENPDPSLFVTGDIWRYQGRYYPLSNFRRVFKYGGIANSVNDALPFFYKTPTTDQPAYNRIGSVPTFDNFVCYFSIGLKYTAPLANISSSYFTVEGSDNYVDHQ